MKPLSKEMLETILNKKIESGEDLALLQEISTQFDTLEGFKKGMEELRLIFAEREFYSWAAKDSNKKNLSQEDNVSSMENLNRGDRKWN
tara:strand:+ start:3298 stop:3564 length:267 start_codon:yes stop_codon:yes gene_type:complete